MRKKRLGWTFPSMLRKLTREVNRMKKIEAIIRPEDLDGVRLSLQEKGIVGMTVEEVQGRGRQKGVCLQWRAGEYCVEFLPKVRMDIIVDDKDVETAIDAVIRAARTGKNGDGKIFIYPVEDVVRISTGERGKEAI
ncbi:putative nitrogen regulatory PII-like protein [uncultured archaeon]|nr:putative nitrogen regulatory PII-like protein [uncultured archaeon]